MNELTNGIRQVTNLTNTDNGAIAYKSTVNKNLDLFATIGAARGMSDEDKIALFCSAYIENSDIAKKILFHLRDCRGGMGERETFRVLLRFLADNEKDYIKDNLQIIPEYGRWDDLFCLKGTLCEEEMVKIISDRLATDLWLQKLDAPISSLAKWMPSENTSSAESRNLARFFAEKLGMTAREYRKTLASLRKYCNVVEVSMSAKDWDKIDYEKVPSKAMANYRNAYARNDSARFTEFIEAVQNGTAKINSAALFPYDIARAYYAYPQFNYSQLDFINEVLEEQWKALPNYAGDQNFLVMADTSGSMTCYNALPLMISISLATYFAEKSKGEFAGKFMTFTDHPRLVELDQSESLLSKLRTVLSSQYVGYDTNLEEAFDVILKAAVLKGIPQEEMPKALIVISDMQINDFGRGRNNLSFTEEMKQRFKDAGYEMPYVVYWNVNAANPKFLADANDDKVRFVSGASPTVFKALCESIDKSAVELMLDTLNDPRYDNIV